MKIKKYSFAVLSKILDIGFSILVGIISFQMFKTEIMIFNNIYQWIYIIYAFDTIFFVLFFKGKTFGTIIMKINIIHANGKINIKLLRIREIVLLLIFNLAMYEYGFVITLLFLPIKNVDNQYTMILDYIFGLKYD